MHLVLASSSSYRKELLQRLSIRFSCQSPDIDESPLANEAPCDTVERLAREKACALRRTFSEHLIIGCDQIAIHADRLINKPGDHQNARLQLQSFSGHRVQFLTALCVLNTFDNKLSSSVVPTEVQFRHLGGHEIERYLAHEQPYDCAGSFKAEGLGIALFEKITSDDPTAIIGLPLIKLCQMLTAHSYNIFDNLM